MFRTACHRWSLLLSLAVSLAPSAASAHPGTGIVVDRKGQIYFVDMVSGVWRLNARGLTHITGPAFHWMALDSEDRFVRTRLPSGSAGDIVHLPAVPSLLLASDVPIAIGRNGSLYFPSRQTGAATQIVELLPSGRQSILATLSTTTGQAVSRDLNDLAAGPDGSLYYTENAAIRRVSRDGHVSTVVERIQVPGCTTAPGGRTRDPLLRGLDVSATGDVYVAATGCATVLKVSPAGAVTVLPQVSNQWAPTGIALSGNDLYILEFRNPQSDDRREMVPRVRRIAHDGTTSVLATVTRR